MSDLSSTLSDVEPEDRHTFVQALAHLAAVDGTIHVDEEAVVQDLLDAWDLDAGQQADIEKLLDDPSRESIEELTGSFADSNTKFLLVQELVRLALADGSYDEEERDGIARIADRIDLPAEQFQEIEEWAERGSVWRRDQSDAADPSRFDDVVSGEEDDAEYDFDDIDDLDSMSATDADLDDIGTEDDYNYDEDD